MSLLSRIQQAASGQVTGLGNAASAAGSSPTGSPRTPDSVRFIEGVPFSDTQPHEPEPRDTRPAWTQRFSDHPLKPWRVA